MLTRDVLAVIAANGLTTRQIHRHLPGNFASLGATVRRLKLEGRAHIVDWVQEIPGKHSAVYLAGAGESRPKPVISKPYRWRRVSSIFNHGVSNAAR